MNRSCSSWLRRIRSQAGALLRLWCAPPWLVAAWTPRTLSPNRLHSSAAACSTSPASPPRTSGCKCRRSIQARPTSPALAAGPWRARTRGRTASSRSKSRHCRPRGRCSLQGENVVWHEHRSPADASVSRSTCARGPGSMVRFARWMNRRLECGVAIEVESSATNAVRRSKPRRLTWRRATNSSPASSPKCLLSRTKLP